jgi:hypothetical protein
MYKQEGMRFMTFRKGFSGRITSFVRNTSNEFIKGVIRVKQLGARDV